MSDSAPPRVQAPPSDHEMLPQFEPASDAAKVLLLLRSTLPSGLQGHESNNALSGPRS